MGMQGMGMNATQNMPMAGAGRQPAVCEARCQLEGAIKDLNSVVGNLVPKLSSVLREPEPSPPVPAAPPVNSPCELAAWINAMAGEIHNVANLLNNVQARMEL